MYIEYLYSMQLEYGLYRGFNPNYINFRVHRGPQSDRYANPQ